MPPIELSGGINFPYENVEIAQALNILPNKYGRIGRRGIFGAGKGVTSTIVEIKRKQGMLVVLGAKERGAEADAIKRPDEDSIFVKIPHFPWKGTLGPDDIQDLLSFNEGAPAPKQQAEAMNELLIDLREPADATTEYTCMGALKGVVKDGYGNTIIDLFDAFEISKKTVYFDLTNENSNIPKICESVTSHVEDNIGGREFTGVHCYVDDTFMGDLINHASVTAFAQSGPAMAVEILRQAKMEREENGFVREYHINGVTFETYRGKATLRDGSTDAYVPSNSGQAFPTGTRNIFRPFYGPAHAMGAANKRGQRIHTTTKVLDHDEGIEVKNQMNELNICAMPEVLVECKGTANPG